MSEVLTVSQVARRFRVPATWIKAQALAGSIPHLRAGSKFLFNPTAMADCLARLAAQYPDKPGVPVAG